MFCLQSICVNFLPCIVSVSFFFPFSKIFKVLTELYTLRLFDQLMCYMLPLHKGPTPLHLAAKCGALDSVSCLLANYANVLAVDDEGWAPIHHAAFYDHEAVLRCFIRRNEALLELQTKNE